jgi:hypothetical protein
MPPKPAKPEEPIKHPVPTDFHQRFFSRGICFLTEKNMVVPDRLTSVTSE